MENNYIALDVDGTLLDSRQLVGLLKEELVLTTGKNENEIVELLKEYKATLEGDSTGFNHVNFINFAVEMGYAREQVESAFNTAEIFEKCVYEEIEEFLQTIQTFCSVSIFSQAIKEWQEHKLKLSGIAALVDDWNAWVIKENKLTREAIELLPSDAILFDDKLEVLEAVRAARPDVRCVWVNRKGDGRVTSFSQIPDFTGVNATFLNQLQNESAKLQVEL